ncbi:TetR/AcrR family transcriptional regulator [Chryseobacterium sp. MMS23-Vi53]|uniref:TetR/AcrR family transcriptional regulator n=1 Tax=Chryseobacterium sp. MMS23-Vi53 TaxID=3386644 RepID=UPI0039EB8633
MAKERKNSVRQSIIETASRLFYKQGYTSTGINQIIAESGVVKSTLYSTFRSKEEILMAYLETEGAISDKELKDATEKFEDPKEKILAVFDYLMNIVQKKDYYGCHFLNIVSEVTKEDEVVRSQIKKQKNKVRQLFHQILEPIEKADLSDEIYTLFEGALAGNKVHDDVFPVLNAKKIAEKLLN